MNVDDYIKEEIEKNKEHERVIEEQEKEIAERKKQEKECAKLQLLGNLGIGEKIYGEVEMTVTGIKINKKEYPFWDSIENRPYRVKADVSDEEFNRLLEHLRQTNNSYYTKYIEEIKKIEKGDMPMSKSYKITITVILIVVFIILSTINIGIRTDAGFTTPGIIGLILLFALGLTLRYIWKRK